MSTFEHRTLTCVRCGHVFPIAVMRGIHITRLPDVRSQILAGTFHQRACPDCGALHAWEGTTVYTDFEAGQYIGVEPGLAPANWRADRKTHVGIFDQAFTFGPSIAEELSHGMRHRLVFGVPSLREKVLIWDAGLDDRVVEALKGDWLRSRGTPIGDEMLRVSAVLPPGHLLCARLSRPPVTGGGPSIEQPRLLGHVTLPHADYLRRQQRQAEIRDEYPWLSDDWCVDLWVTRPPESG